MNQESTIFDSIIGETKISGGHKDFIMQSSIIAEAKFRQDLDEHSTILVLSPSYRQSRQFLERIENALRLYDPDLKYERRDNINESKIIIGKCTILAKPANANKLRGLNIGHLYANDSDMMPSEITDLWKK